MITVDARGKQCPIPVIMTKKAIEALSAPDTLEVFVDNETAVGNVTRLAGSLGAAVASEQLAEKDYRLEITVAKLPGAEHAAAADAAVEAAASCACDPNPKGDFIVVVPSATMGVGNDELGKVLIKGFLFAVSQLDVLPKKILFYNGGATLTVEGSASLADLKGMAEKGVEILTCGTCLDYYGIKEKLAVGAVTNMYAIVESMATAGKVIRP